MTTESILPVSVRARLSMSLAELAAEDRAHAAQRDAYLRRQRSIAAELSRVAAEQDWPRLRIWRSPIYLDWWWQVDDPAGWVISTGVAGTHGEALAVGLSALEAASLHPAR